MHIHGDPAAVISDGNTVVAVNNNIDLFGMASERFVDGIIHDFIDQVVQTAHADVADIHRGAFTDRLHPLKDLDAFGAVVFIALFGLFYL